MCVCVCVCVCVYHPLTDYFIVSMWLDTLDADIETRLTLHQSDI